MVVAFLLETDTGGPCPLKPSLSSRHPKPSSDRFATIHSPYTERRAPRRQIQQGSELLHRCAGGGEDYYSAAGCLPHLFFCTRRVSRPPCPGQSNLACKDQCSSIAANTMLDRMAIAHGAEHMDRHATRSNSKNSPPTLPGDETPRCHHSENPPAGRGEPGASVSWTTNLEVLTWVFAKNLKVVRQVTPVGPQWSSKRPFTWGWHPTGGPD